MICSLLTRLCNARHNLSLPMEQVWVYDAIALSRQMGSAFEAAFRCMLLCLNVIVSTSILPRWLCEANHAA